MGTMFQSIQGPADSRLEASVLDGYQPVSRIGEVVINAFVDAHEFSALPAQLTRRQMDPDATGPDEVVESKPRFHEWATVLPGMICLSRKARNATFRNYVAAETATPVISSAACLSAEDSRQYFFAGVARSKSVRPVDDGVGPSVDEFFTLAIGGMATLLNTSREAIYPGDYVEWCLYSEARPATGPNVRPIQNPRRVGMRSAAPNSERVIGKALSFAKAGQSFDIMLRSA